MWNNYFFNIQAKYSMRLSTKKPLVIRFDGKDVTKNKDINLFYNIKYGFIDSLKQSAIHFSKKYHCLAIFGSDEISFIFKDPLILLKDLSSDIPSYSNETISLFSQYFFYFFNNIYTKEKIFFHGKCFSIPEEKIESYIKYRSGIIKNVMTTYFLIMNNDYKVENLEQRIDRCKKYRDFNELSDAVNGYLFFDGNKIDLYDYLNGNITIIEDEKDNDNNNFELNSNSNIGMDIEFLDF